MWHQAPKSERLVASMLPTSYCRSSPLMLQKSIWRHVYVMFSKKILALRMMGNPTLSKKVRSAILKDGTGHDKQTCLQKNRIVTEVASTPKTFRAIGRQEVGRKAF
jgi:hypothetical protein